MNKNLRPFLDHWPNVADSSYIDPAASVIGQVSIGQHSSVWPNVVIRGDVNTITVGDYTNIQDGSVLHCTHDGPFTAGGQALTIDSHVTIGHMVMLHGATIEDRCLIGMNAVLLDGCHIEPHTLIAAGSLVPQGKRLEGGYLWLGQPVRRVRPLSQQEIDNINYSAQFYAKLKDKYCRQ